MDSLEGHLLVASPHLQDTNFVKSVVLIVQHNDDGALGVVVNRPTSKLVHELWDEVGQSPCASDQPVFLGGPVSGPIMAVHAHESLAEVEVLPGLFFAAKKANLDQLVAQSEHPYRIFVGHSGWGPGQLEGELEVGAWFTLPAKAEYVFYDHAEGDLWAEVSKQIGHSMIQGMLGIKEVPEDPSLN